MDALTSGRTGSVVLLVALLAGFFGLMSFQADRAATVSTVQGAILTAVSPVQRLLSASWLSAAGVWNRYVGLVGARSESRRLRQEIARLERRQAALGEAARENARLRRLLGLRDSLPVDGRAAEVVGRDLIDRYGTLTVDRGSRDGVERDATVLSPGGDLVGRVVHVAPWTSIVQLITDVDSAVAVRTARARAGGVLQGEGTRELRLSYVESREDVKAGDMVVTSGDDGLYPDGIPVGRVREVRVGPVTPDAPRIPLSRDESALFLEITVTPNAELRNVEHVLLLAPVTS